MGTTTTNLSLYKPADAETDWGSNVNGNFDTLDGKFGEKIWMPDSPPSSPSDYDDEFNDESLDTGLWTEFDEGSILTVSEDVAGLKLALSANAGTDFSGVYQSIQAGDFTYVTKIGASVNARNMYVHYGLFLMEGATATSDLYGIIFNIVRGGATYTQRFAVIYYTDYQTLNDEKDYEAASYIDTYVYLRIRRNGTTYYFDWSKDGINWRWLYTESSLPFTAAAVGLLISCEDATYVATGRADFFRYKNSDVGFDGYLEGDQAYLIR